VQFLHPYNMAMLARVLGIADRLQKTQRSLFRKEETCQLETAVENVFNRHHFSLGLLGDGLPDETPALTADS
jgi:hypothetical protein